MPYSAFMSYSHSADGTLARALQSALHWFAKPWYKVSFNLAFHPRSAGPAAGASIVLPGDELPMPRKESLRRDDCCNRRQSAPAESFCFGRKSTALLVGKPESATTKLLTQDLFSSRKLCLP